MAIGRQIVSAAMMVSGLAGLFGSAPVSAALISAIPLKEAAPAAILRARPCAGPGAAALAPADAEARALVRRAIEAQGGEARLRQIDALKVETIGHRYLLDQSERPEGPWIASYEQRTELRDLAKNRLRSSTSFRMIQGSTWTPELVTIVDTAGADPSGSGGVAANARGDTFGPGRAHLVRDAADLLALEPERLLLTALAAPDLRQVPDVRLQEVAQHVLTFTANGRAVRLLLNMHTLLPTAVDVTTDSGEDSWGEITRRTLLSYWNIESNGLRYPRQRNVLWNGVPQSEASITALTINPPIEPEAFAIPDSVRTAFATVPQLNARTIPLGQRNPSSSQPAPAAAAAATPAGIAVETLADGIIQIPGMWNVAMVRQTDGIVIIEAPISSEYSAQVLDEAARRFRGGR